MKIYKEDDFGVIKIDFCCGKMGSAVLLGEVSTKHWTDHPLFFWIGETRLNNCPFCGAEINGDAR